MKFNQAPAGISFSISHPYRRGFFLNVTKQMGDKQLQHGSLPPPIIPLNKQQAVGVFKSFS
jgi:hypothetical protein